MIGELGEDSRPMRRGALRHGHAGLCRCFRTHLGSAAAALLLADERALARWAVKPFPASLFMAEVYWDLEWTLQQQGFDYTASTDSTIACGKAMR